MFDQFFLSAQMKRNLIIINKYGIYELPHEFPNDLRLRILGNWKYQENIKILWNYSLLPSLPPKIKILSILEKNC